MSGDGLELSYLEDERGEYLFNQGLLSDWEELIFLRNCYHNMKSSKKKEPVDVTGTLEDWRVQKFPGEGASEFIIWGYVWGDKKGRFSNGQYIHTAGISHDQLDDLDNGTLVTTRNSTYRLGARLIES